MPSAGWGREQASCLQLGPASVSTRLASLGNQIQSVFVLSSPLLGRVTILPTPPTKRGGRPRARQGKWYLTWTENPKVHKRGNSQPNLRSPVPWTVVALSPGSSDGMI